MGNHKNLNKMNQYMTKNPKHKIMKSRTRTSSSISSIATDIVSNRIPKTHKILLSSDLKENSKPIKSLINQMEYKNENYTTNDNIQNKNNNIINESLYYDLLEIEGKRIINHLSDSIKVTNDGKYIINSKVKKYVKKKSISNDNYSNIINQNKEDIISYLISTVSQLKNSKDTSISHRKDNKKFVKEKSFSMREKQVNKNNFKDNKISTSSAS